MAEATGRRENWLSFLRWWRWCAVVLVCIGCQRTPAPAPFHRFVEEVAPGDRWHETKVHIGSETRNVLFAPYRSALQEIEVAQDGTIPLGAVAEIERISPDATGVTVEVRRLPSGEQSPAQDGATRVYVPLEGDVAELARRKVEVLAAGEAGREVQASARAVFTLPREYVTKPVTVPPSAWLDFGIGIEGKKSEVQPSAVRFSIEVQREDEHGMIFSQTLDPESELPKRRWIDASVDLSDMAGSSVRFVFSTESGEQGAGSNPVVPLFDWSPVWGNPILYSAEAERPDNRPNVILISPDMLRPDHLGCYGYHRNTSPNIDRFAEESFLFENCIAASSWTVPSYASVFTGLQPSLHGAVINCPPVVPVDAGETTLGELARGQGYLTAAYTEPVYVSPGLGFAQGFDTFWLGSRRNKDAETTFSKALQWIRKHRELPFCLLVYTMQVHGPYTPPGRFATMFDGDYSGPISHGTFDPLNCSDRDKVHLQALYDGDIAYTDEVVGNFLEQLRQMNLLDDALVIIWSDHGHEFWEHGSLGHGNTLYEEVVRVPLIIKVPGKGPAAGRITRQVSLIDLYATVVEILGISHDVPTYCFSLAPLMGVSKWRARYDRTFVVSELYEDKTGRNGRPVDWWMRSVRTDDEKYIVSGKNQTEELYDLRADPGETNNIAAQNEARLEHYRKLLQLSLKAAAAGRAPSSPSERHGVSLTEEEKRELKALGYI